MKTQMVDIKGQYQRIKNEIDAGIQKCVDNAALINIPAAKEFQQYFEKYLISDAKAIADELYSIFASGTVKKKGTIEYMECTSFFPSKELEC